MKFWRTCCIGLWGISDEDVNCTQIAELMGITVGQVTAYAKSGELINGRYKVVRIPEKFDPELVPLMSEWEKVTEPFRRVIWCKHLTDGVRQLGGGLKWRC